MLALCTLGAAMEQPGRSNRTPLHLACERGHAECVEALLAAGASTRALDSVRFAPAACCGAVASAFALVAAVCSPETHTHTVFPPPPSASLTPPSKQFEHVPLHLAARAATPAHTACLHALLRSSAAAAATGGAGPGPLDPREDAGRTPLLLAAWLGSEANARALLAAGADREARDAVRASENASLETNPAFLYSSFLRVSHGSPQSVRSLSNPVRSCPSAQRHWTPLHWAADSGRADTLSALLEAGADREARDKARFVFSCVPVLIAAWNTSKRGLLDRRNVMIAFASTWLSAAQRGLAPIHLAARRGFTACVRALLAAGADKEAQDEARA